MTGWKIPSWLGAPGGGVSEQIEGGAGLVDAPAAKAKPKDKKSPSGGQL